MKGRGTSSEHEVRTHIANRDAGNLAASDATSRLLGVMTCLQGDPLPVDAPEAPLDPLQLAAVMEPTEATMSTSCIVKDEATGVTYMDTVTTSVGQVALSGTYQGTPAKGPIIEDITDLS